MGGNARWKMLWLGWKYSFAALEGFCAGFHTCKKLKRVPFMSSIHYALEKLDQAVSRLDDSVSGVQHVPGNVIDVDFVSKRLDSAIAKVEDLLGEGE